MIERKIQPSKYKVFKLETEALRSILLAQKNSRQNEILEVLIPDPAGKLIKFNLKISPIMESGLAAKFPDIITFTLSGSGYSGRGDMTQYGFHAMLISGSHTYFIDPLDHHSDTHYQVYFKSDYSRNEPVAFSCEVENNLDELPSDQEKGREPEIKSLIMGHKRSAAVNLRTYRLALACTGEYAQFHGGTVSSVMAQMVIAINRVNTVYENDLAVRLIIIDGNEQLIFLNAEDDPYTNNSGSTMLGQNQSTINSIIGAANYDIGHVFSTGGGGIASLRSVCGNSKARGVTGLGSPVGDPFYIDYVCHEIGHQFGGNHTFNNCNGNENASTSFEPGSGSTIMAYAGICGAANNVQFRSDDYFHVASLEEIFAFSRNGNGNTCATIIPTDNVDPIANVISPANLVIPISTPFELEGIGIDDTLQSLQYTWEQYDLGPVSTMGNPIGNGPLFRSLKPGPSPVRSFPALTNILNGTSTTREVLPTTGRPLNFKFIVRDFAAGGGGIDWASFSMSSTETAGPFTVTTPLAADTLIAGSIAEIQWIVANTDQAPVNCQFVDIIFSRNGGNTFTDTLAKNVPNSGAAIVLLPEEITNQGRIKVKAAGNVFFNVNPGNFRLVAPTIPSFSFAVASPTDLICVPEIINLPIESRSLLEYDKPIHLEIINLSVQNDITFNFLDNPMIPGSNSSLEINIGAIENPISFDIMATGEDADTIIIPVQLSTRLSISGQVNLIFPESGSSSVSTIPAFEWEPVIGATRYLLEISTNPDFANPEISMHTDDYTTDLNQLLLQNTLYFWRVRGINECSSTQFSKPNAFYTTILDCETYDKPVDIAISASGTPSINSSIEVSNDIEVTDVFLNGIRGNHQWFSDLDFYLTSPDGTEILLVQRKCGASGGSFNFGFSDESLTEFSCPPNQMRQYLPAQPLSDFKGKRSAGNWTLTVKDTRATSGGRLLGWGLGICGPVNSTQPDLIRNELLELKPGHQRFISNDFLLVTDQSAPASSLSYILVSLPGKGELLHNGESMSVGDQFSQEEINNRSIIYGHLSDQEEEDSFDFVVVNGNGGWLDIHTFKIITDEDFTSSIIQQSLSNSFKVFPNPATTSINVFLEGDFGFTEVQVLNQLGKLIRLDRYDLPTNQTAMDIHHMQTGTYFVRLLGPQLSLTKSFVIVK